MRAAYDREGMRIQGFMLLLFVVHANAAAPARVAPAFAKTRCPAETTTPATLWEAREGSCLQSWNVLDTADGLSLIEAKYAAPADPDDASGPTVVTEVLFELQDATALVRPLWLRHALSDDETFTAVSSHRVGAHRIVEIRACLNGTGGCGQDLVLWNPGKDALPLVPLRAAFEKELPNGCTTLKAPLVNFRDMRVEGYGWRAGDSNSSPSVEMKCDVALDGEALVPRRCAWTYTSR